MMLPRQLLLGWLLIASVLLTGCSRYNLQEVRIAFAAGNFEGALAQLDEAAPKSPKLPYLFERGLVAHYADRLDVSNQAFDQAELIAEELYTKSLSREIGALLTSDNIRSYAGTRYERILVHYYRALNYAYLNQPDEALVECRRAGRLLQQYADKDATYDFAGAAFLAYLSGILYEWSGDWNDAYISYRWAEAGYERYADLGVSLPEDVGHALVRLARKLEFTEESERYVELYGEPPSPSPNSGELILIYESGFVPQKAESGIFFPIFKTDKLEKDEEIWDYTDTVMRRRGMKYAEENLEYLLRVSIPVYSSNRPRLVGVEAKAAGIQVRGVRVEDVEAAALATFAAEQATILLRTVARGLLKYFTYRKAKQKNSIAGFAANLLHVATERADTRSWETLPNQIFLVRMSLPTGFHDVTLTFLDRHDRPSSIATLDGVEIRANSKTFLNYRTFE